MLYTIETLNPLDQVMEDLQNAVTKRNFGVLTVHNLKETMQNKGVSFERECRIFEVCNPHQAKKVLESNAAISTALPCRIAVYEEGGHVKLAMIKPTTLLAMFKEPELQTVADEIEGLMIEMMKEAAGIIE